MNKQYLNKQRGATLIVSLITLLALSLIASSSIKSSNVQELMSSNSQQKVLSRYAAEFALKEAEEWLINNVRSTANIQLFDGKNGLYSALPRPELGLAQPLNSTLDITNTKGWEKIGVEVNGLDKKVAIKKPKYIIEYVGRGQLTSASSTVTQLNTEENIRNISPYFFRITAIGWSRDESIYSVLSSSFRTGHGKNEFSY